MTVGRVLSLAREIATVMLNCGYEFQYGYCHVPLAVFHQFLNSADTISQNQTSVINPRDLKKKSIVLNFCLLFVVHVRLLKKIILKYFQIYPFLSIHFEPLQAPFAGKAKLIQPYQFYSHLYCLFQFSFARLIWLYILKMIKLL